MPSPSHSKSIKKKDKRQRDIEMLFMSLFDGIACVLYSRMASEHGSQNYVMMTIVYSFNDAALTLHRMLWSLPSIKVVVCYSTPR